jgi:hypothetical protein
MLLTGSKTEGGKQEYHCDKCDYTCSATFLFKQHLATKKHRLGKPHIMLKCTCGREYRHVQSYRRHAKTCDGAPRAGRVEPADADDRKSDPDDPEKVELRAIIKTLVDQNRTILLENQKMQSVVREMLPKIGSNNTTFNLQVFLNEKCKDAINLSEFVEGLKLEAGDLDKTRELGYAGGVADILVRGLRQMEIHRRPIHCSNVQRETLYVRDKDAWEHGEGGRGHLKAAISTVAQRQTGKINEWEAANPAWNRTDEGTQRYIQMVSSVTDKGEDGRPENEIIASVAREVEIGREVEMGSDLLPAPQQRVV